LAVLEFKPLTKKEKVVNYTKICKSALVAMLTLAGSVSLVAQSEKEAARKFDVVTGNNLYCAGFVQMAPMYTAPREVADRANKIVGSYNEQDGYYYSQNSLLLVNGGADKGVKVGDMFSVVRPRGEIESRWSHKGRLGVYVQEVGVVQVTKVKDNLSVVRAATSCDSMMLGDLLVPYEKRSSSKYVLRPKLDLFADPSGKAVGRIIMARDGREMVSRDQIVFVDLGMEDHLAQGDYVTVYRPLGKGNLTNANIYDETVSARDEGFQSDKYRGGKFSNQSARKYGSSADRKVVTTADAKGYRPEGLRKVVGEGMVVSVKERTATIVITRTAQEIHTGDWVEIQ